ncbi:MAG TPA: asparaginase [Paracoccaceae bacterium]|nr:asparaginase [Paracoccaceae bacterium]
MPHICLITTGGTIASRKAPGADRLDVGLSGQSVLGAVSRLPSGVSVAVDEFASILSPAMTLPLAFDLCQRIRQQLADPGCIGVVVTHGTDTMEETAFLADLLVGGDKPVIFAGAQKAADDPASDGPRNLTDALTAAASPTCRAMGVMVLFEQHLHAARDVRKAHTSRVDAFRSASHGKLGEVDGDTVTIARLPAPRLTLTTTRIEPLVDLIPMAMGCDDRLIRASAASGTKAIVLEAFGRGNVTPPVATAAVEICQTGLPLIITSRCGDGRVLPAYGGPGGGKVLADAGAIFAGDLCGRKARILAAVLSGAGAGPEEMRQTFASFGDRQPSRRP